MSVVVDELNAIDGRPLNAEEMGSIRGGQKADIGGWSALGEVVDAVVAPINFAAIEKWAKQQASKNPK